MWYNCRTLLITLLLGASGTALAAVPEFLPPTSMQVDPGSKVIARGLDFVDAPMSGAVNYSPQNYDIHLPGGIIIPIQDVVPYFGIQQPIKDCQGMASATIDTMMIPFNTLLYYVFPKVLGVNQVPKNVIDPKTLYNQFLVGCNNDPNMMAVIMAEGKLPKQIVADVRNGKSGATDVVFSGQLLDPYTEFPQATPGVAGVVIGGNSTDGKDPWNDGIVIAAYKPFFADTFGTPLMSSALNLYRFLPNAASKKILQYAGISTGWLDKPIQTNGKVSNPCFKGDPNDPQNPVTMKNDAELLAAGCVGENLAVAVATPNFYGHPGDKLKDIVVVSRAQIGNQIGYITVYKRNEALAAPADTTLFQDIWQFDKSVTHTTNGIPEPYGIAVVKNWDAKVAKFTEGVVVGSNKLQGTRYYVYYYTNNGKEPQAISVGGVDNQTLPGFGGFGPYRVYSADVNLDKCGDILVTRAKISPDGKTIQFADYFDVHLQQKLPIGECSGTFQFEGTKYQIPPVDPKMPSQISSLVVADFNKDGRIDVIAGDFTTYVNATTKIRENVVHYLEYKDGLFNTVQPPHYVVTTKEHGPEVGVIDVKADAHANLGVVTGDAMVFAPLVPLPTTPKSACDEGLIGSPYSLLCTCGRDVDQDGVKNLNVDKNFFPKGLGVIQVDLDCTKEANGDLKYTDLDLTSKTPVKYTDCNGISITETPRKLLIDWTHCDNCNDFDDKCIAPEAGAPGGASNCWNKSQKDSDSDGYGDVCDAQPNDSSQSRLAPRFIPVAKVAPRIREDRVMYAGEQPVIAYKEQLELTALPADNGHEVTVLLNKTNVKGTPPPACQNGDLTCICQQNPDIQICKCQKDPNAPGCKVGPVAQVSCCLDVCRGDLTAPYPAMCDFVRPLNDEIRKITGLCMDVLVPVEGTQYHLSCTMPNAPALDLGAGKAYAQVFKSAGGQIPKNYFKDWHKPVADRNLLSNNVLLNPADDAAGGGVPLDLNKLPKPDFSYDASLSAVSPDVSVNQAPGITQIDGIMQIETYLADIDPATGAAVTKQTVGPGGGAPAIAKALLLDIKGYSSPPGCQWVGSDCPVGMPNPPSPRKFVDAIQAKVTEFEAAGKPVTIDTITEAFKSMDVGPAFLHQQFVVAGSQGAMVIPIQNVMGGFGAEGGCGCTFSAVPTSHNTLLPLLMSVTALGGIFVLRLRSAKKR